MALFRDPARGAWAPADTRDGARGSKRLTVGSPSGDGTGVRVWSHPEEWPEAPPRAPEHTPLVVTFFTRGTPYEELAAEMARSCETQGVPVRSVGVTPDRSWERNCARKAGVIRDTWRDSHRPVLWLDADATLHRPPHLLADLHADFAVHLHAGWRMLSGTAWFNQSDRAGDLLDRWCALCEQRPGVWDQLLLDLAWEQATRAGPLVTAWLPSRYARIAGLDSEADLASAVVAHGQASRRLKAEMGSDASFAKRPEPTPDVRAARAEGRPRTTEAIARHPDGFRTVRVDPTSLNLDSKRALTSLAAGRCRAAGHTRVVLYGAGAHTRSIGFEPYEAAGLEPIGVIDDSPSQPDVNGVPVISRAQVPSLGSTAVIISSDAHERRLTERAATLGMPVYTIYAALTTPVAADETGA
jgi:hypothetical protein